MKDKTNNNSISEIYKREKEMQQDYIGKIAGIYALYEKDVDAIVDSIGSPFNKKQQLDVARDIRENRIKELNKTYSYSEDNNDLIK